ncbi:hypothetical protein [uncultured Dysosmobacter sp.]|uniref:hypothetical protein n=1 Tax=uncultured Dysosmobacter sp. TaxID=2591384 RepID=UPI0026041A41|nr:hypothetical protein [uncultured Dysosmobacter sp.]
MHFHDTVQEALRKIWSKYKSGTKIWRKELQFIGKGYTLEKTRPVCLWDTDDEKPHAKDDTFVDPHIPPALS